MEYIAEHDEQSEARDGFYMSLKFETSRDGNIAQSWRYNYIRDKKDHMIDRPGVDRSAEEAQKKWNEIRTEWYRRLEVILQDQAKK